MKKVILMLMLLMLSGSFFYNLCYSKEFEKTQALLHKAETLIKNKRFGEAIDVIDQTFTVLTDELEQEKREIDSNNKEYNYNTKLVNINNEILRNNNNLERLYRQELYLRRSQTYLLWSIYKKGENDIDVKLAEKALKSLDEADKYYVNKLSALDKKNVLTEEEKKDQESYVKTAASLMALQIGIVDRIAKYNNNLPHNKKYREGEKFAREKKYGEAVKSFTAAIKLDPEFIKAYKERLNCYLEENKLDEALADSSKIIEINNRNGKPDPLDYLKRAKIYYSKDMPSEALRDLEKLPSDNGDAYYYRGYCYDKLNDTENKIKNYEIAVTNYPSSSYLAHEYLFRYYYNKKDYKNALRICDTRLKTFNRDFDMLLWRGKVYLLGMDDERKALADFTKSIEIYPMEENYYYRGLAYAYDNEWDLAIKDWNNEKCKYHFTKLFHKKSDMNAVDENGATVAMWVVYDQKPELLKLLYKKGADFDKKGVIWDNKEKGFYYGGMLHLAAGLHLYDSDNQIEIIKFLVEKCGIDVDDGQIDYQTKKVTKFTPLFWACRSGNSKAFNYLVSKGADINADYNGMTPMSALISGSINEEIFDYLYKKKAKVNYRDPELFLDAAYYGNFKVAAVFIENGVNINSNRKGLTALHYAAKYGKLEAAELLINRHIDVNINENGLTALQYAVNSGNKEIVELLLKNGADYKMPFIKKDKDRKETDRWTPLQLAEKKKYKEIAALLKKYGAKK